MASRLCWTFLPVFIVLACNAPCQAQRRNQEGLRRRWSVYDFPDPNSQNRDQQNLCGRQNISSVCDPNSIISRAQANAIDDLIKEVYRDTECPCSACKETGSGFVIRVAIMPYFERLYNDSASDTRPATMLRNARMFSYILSQRWRMEGKCNETVLIAYARDDNMLYTLTRRTSMVKLREGDIQSILLIVRHYFDNAATIGDGILEMIHRYKLVFQDRYQDATENSSNFRTG